ncbi:candidapepsin-1 [Sodiomyces alkalinus F11]|uniref:Candidapepsin-1 n=1 Tax=Sodiomyces alkalinus (strain CBS 110278 / VKM F-3762 / F11) TaxID=1314773 RepID=A0A3N2Q4P4_SODAK|nr:candidapepsin-1 [Sodiomyces alkalinus F11]ROT41722.1 candidapepsin-1 [Sodiomyces alkalinus F11]
MAALRVALYSTCLAAYASSVLSLPRDTTTGPSAKHAPVTLPLYQDIRIDSIDKLRRKRQNENDDTTARIINVTSTSYLIELAIGTPGQDLRVALDTGSSELWVNPNCQNAGSPSQERICETHGHYRPADSDTARVSQTRSTISYGKGQVALQYVADNIAVPGTDITISDVIFGYATNSRQLSTGIMGLSFGNGTNMAYPSVLDEMVAQDIIETHAFGVALGTKDEPTGTGVISFGGVDTQKFSGDLHTMPVLGPQHGERLWRYWVQLESMGLTISGGGGTELYDGSSFPVFFDTGATLSYLPRPVVQALAEDLGGQLDPDVDLYVVPCGQEGTVDFTFAGYTIKVPLEEFIWTVGQDTCILGADAEESQNYLLGDSFLRSVYTVFDMETPALHFAPYVNCGSNVRMIPPGLNATTEFTGECSSSDSGSGDGNGGDGDGDSAAGHLTPMRSLWAVVAGSMAAYQAMMLL